LFTGTLHAFSDFYKQVFASTVRQLVHEVNVHEAGRRRIWLRIGLSTGLCTGLRVGLHGTAALATIRSVRWHGARLIVLPFAYQLLLVASEQNNSYKEAE
jgi:hypothetical protein